MGLANDLRLRAVVEIELQLPVAKVQLMSKY